MNNHSKRSPRAYVRPGFATPTKDNNASPFAHLVNGCGRVMKSASENEGVASFSVAYHSPEQLAKSIAWMKETGIPQYLSGADVTMFTDTTKSEGKTLPRLWVQILLNNSKYNYED